MAEKRTIDINIQNNADQAAKDFNTFNDALDQTAKTVKSVDDTFEQVYGDLQPLTTRLGEAEDRLYELAIAGDTTSKEYQELLTKVGEYRKVQINTDLAVDSAATTLGQKLGGALSGATSGFAAIQGAMGLVGGESEQLEKALLKVQSALAIQQGVQGIREAIPSIKQLGTTATTAFKAMSTGAKAFAVTGIGVVLTALGVLIAKLQEVDDEEEKLAEERERRAKQAKENLKEDLKFSDAILESNRRAFAKETARNKLQQENAKSEQERFELQRENREAYIKLLENEIRIAQENITINELSFEQQEAIQKQIFELQKEVAIANTENAIEEIKNTKRRAKEYQEYLKTRQDIARQIEDLENSLLEEGIEKELEINRDKFRRLREDAKKNTELTLKERRRLNDLYTEQEAKSEAEIRDKFRKEALQEEIDFFTENKLPVLQAIADKEVEIQINKYSLMGEALEAQLKKEAELRKRNQDFAVQTTLDGLSLISDITELFGKKGEKQAKRAFQVQKAAQIAAATIETYRSAQAAYLSQFLPVPDPSSPVRGGIAAGVAVAAGLANIAKIASQKFEGGGATGGGADFSGGGVGGGEVVSPEFNVVGDSSVNQLAQLQQTPTQAYVVSGEVTSAQALDRNRVTNATL